MTVAIKLWLPLFNPMNGGASVENVVTSREWCLLWAGLVWWGGVPIEYREFAGML